MLPVLYQLFPNDFHRLVEVFGGGAAVIFGREPGRCEETLQQIPWKDLFGF